MIAASGVFLAALLVAVALPLGGALAQDAGPTAAPTGTATPVPGPTATPTGPTLTTEGTSITDTEYLSVPIDPTGAPDGTPTLKDWLRVRGAAGNTVGVLDPGRFDGVKTLSGSPGPASVPAPSNGW